MKITGTNNESKCSYCGSTAYGRSCAFGPKKTHVHQDDPLRCSFCGSTALGPGCPFNPFSKYHQRGAVFNSLALESVESGIVRGIVMSRLGRPITEMRAFTMGLIDDKGNQIREPQNIEERNALTSSDKYLIKLRRLAEKNIDMINTTLYFESKDEEYDLSDLKKMYPIELDCKNDITLQVEKLVSVVDKYLNMGLSEAKVEKFIAESILNAKNDTEDGSRKI